ncbi:CopG family transcriptional regulator [Actinomyces faecalis]|uniref:ribbon-helix-helix domain-containing protein n=1 Tax=Actinomyces faecalis TaxID=2722820 RepID=UPI0015543F69|nr:CopG family transcriptional regulator [Actinomyces faecalis]
MTTSKPTSEMTGAELDAHLGLDTARYERLAHEYESDAFPDDCHTSVVRGRPRILGEETATLTLRVPRGLADALTDKAQREGVSRSALIRTALAQAV